VKTVCYVIDANVIIYRPSSFLALTSICLNIQGRSLQALSSSCTRHTAEWKTCHGSLDKLSIDGRDTTVATNRLYINAHVAAGGYYN